MPVNVGDFIIARWGGQPCKTRSRVARVARLDPLGIQFAGRISPGFRTASGRGEFRPKWMTKVHDVSPDAILRPATRRELVLGYPDVTPPLESVPT